MNESPRYDRIGGSYAKHRSADPRLVDGIVSALDLAPESVIAEIGAGCGNYSRALADRGFQVRAIEPSPVMRDQAQPHSRVEWHEGVAERVPLADSSVDAVVVVMALHHFQSVGHAADEMLRITNGPIVIFTYDPRPAEEFWLSDYFPEIFADGFELFPSLADVASLFDRESTIRKFELPHDLQDLFLAAGWRRPEIYLNPDICAGMSVLALADPHLVKTRIDRLRNDLDSGDWHRRYGPILEKQEFDAGYRLLRLEPDGLGRLP
jgi:ubiquinone/menaquinone biosynthesis C-methylase UbiE